MPSSKAVQPMVSPFEFSWERVFPRAGAAELDTRWHSSAPLVEHGGVDRFGSLFDGGCLESLDHALERSDDEGLAAFGTRGEGVPAEPNGNTLQALLNLSRQQARARYDEGYSIQVRKAERFDPRLAVLTQSLATSVGMSSAFVEARLIFSPPGATDAYGWHSDEFDNIVVQVRGRKTWELGVRVAPGRPIAADVDLEGSPPPVTRRETLTPGSALYSPRGLWHRTRGSAEGSVSVAFEFRPVTWSSLATFVCARALSQAESLRGTPRQLLGAGVDDIDPQVGATIERALASLRDADWGTLLRHAALAMGRQSSGSMAMRRLAHRPSPAGPEPRFCMAVGASVETPTLHSDGDGCTVVVTGDGWDHALEVDIETAVLLQWIGRRGRVAFAASEAAMVAGLAELDAVAELLSQLAEIGLLQSVPMCTADVG